MPAKKAVLNVAEKFYVESHYKKKGAGEIAKELGVKVALVKAVFTDMEAAGVQVEPDKSNVSKAGYGERPGIVVATEASATIGDEHRKTVNNGSDFIKKRLGKNIHIMDKNRPSY